MPIEPIKIPQNVQVEDRLIGFVTMRQVFLCLTGGGISYVIWNILKSAGLATTGSGILAWSPLAIAAAFAFIRYQNLTLLHMILLFLERGNKPPLRTFGPRTGITMNVEKYYETESTKEQKHPRHSLERDKLNNLSSLLDESDTPENTHQNDTREKMSANESTMPVDPNRVSVDKPQANTRSVDGVIVKLENAIDPSSIIANQKSFS